MSSSNKTKRWVAIAIIVAVVVIAAVKKFRGHDTSDPRLVGKVERQDLIQRITVAGNIVGRRSSYIQPTYASYVAKLFVKLGDKVKSGQPLVSLSPNPTDTASGFPLRAPFDGTVVQVLVDVGDYVEASASADKSLLRVDDMSEMYVEADVPELEYPKIVLNQEVIIKASAILERKYKGRIVEKFLASKKSERWEKGRVEYPVRIQISDPDEKLKPGMSAIVDIVAFRKDKVLTLRQEFVQSEGEKYFVITRRGDKKDVEVGAQNDEVFEIKSGLQEATKCARSIFYRSTAPALTSDVRNPVAS